MCRFFNQWITLTSRILLNHKRMLCHIIKHMRVLTSFSFPIHLKNVFRVDDYMYVQTGIPDEERLGYWLLLQSLSIFLPSKV